MVFKYIFLGFIESLETLTTVQFSSVQFSHSVMSDSLQPHESQHARPPCPSPTPGVHSDSRPQVSDASSPPLSMVLLFLVSAI